MNPERTKKNVTAWLKTMRSGIGARQMKSFLECPRTTRKAAANRKAVRASSFVCSLLVMQISGRQHTNLVKRSLRMLNDEVHQAMIYHRDAIRISTFLAISIP